MRGVDLHITSSDKPLFVAFGGIAQQLSMPPFEFKNFLTKNFGDINFIFIRDTEQAWYFNGIEGLSTNMSLNIDGLKMLINQTPHTKTIFLGNSMGGYASILYGALLNVDHVLAFAPQTFVDKVKRAKHSDNRWPQQMKKLHGKYPTHKYYDLEELEAMEFDTDIRVFYSPQSKLDTVHANNIKHINNVDIHVEPKGGHGVIKTLKNNGKLAEIIKDILDE